MGGQYSDPMYPYSFFGAATLLVANLFWGRYPLVAIFFGAATLLVVSGSSVLQVQHKSSFGMKRTRTIETQELTRPKAFKGTGKTKSTNFSVPRYLAPVRNGFPKILKVKHRYCESVSLTSGLGTVQYTQFSVNGLFDPNTSIGGHQPKYFSQLTALYNHYTVTKSKITARFTPGSVHNCKIGIYIEDDTSIAPTTGDSMAEQASAVTSSTIQFATVPVKLTKSWNAIQNFGPNPLANDNLQGTSSANPAEGQYYTLFFQDLAGAAAVTMGIYVVIEYEATWDELKPL